jgi:hypothetical protein
MLHDGRQAIIDRYVDIALGGEVICFVDAHVGVGFVAVSPAPAMDHQYDRQILRTVRRVDIQVEEVRVDTGYDSVR